MACIHAHTPKRHTCAAACLRAGLLHYIASLSLKIDRSLAKCAQIDAASILLNDSTEPAITLTSGNTWLSQVTSDSALYHMRYIVTVLDSIQYSLWQTASTIVVLERPDNCKYTVMWVDKTTVLSVMHTGVLKKIHSHGRHWSCLIYSYCLDVTYFDIYPALQIF